MQSNNSCLSTHLLIEQDHVQEKHNLGKENYKKGKKRKEKINARDYLRIG